MRRKRIVAGNWKMNLNQADAIKLIEGVKPNNTCTTAVFPSFVYLSSVKAIAQEKGILIGAQNGYYEKEGAYTGEVSFTQLKDIGVEAILIGHSERRSLFKESDAFLKLKVNAAIEHELIPFFCCGETLDERKNNQHFQVVTRQLEEALFHLDVAQIVKVVIAYEPVWAIGTGETASPVQAEEMHLHIREQITKKYGSEIAQTIPLLYGGSCKPNNAKELFEQKNIDGGLIGGASLKADEFNQIIASF